MAFCCTEGNCWDNAEPEELQAIRCYIWIECRHFKKNFQKGKKKPLSVSHQDTMEQNWCVCVEVGSDDSGMLSPSYIYLSPLVKAGSPVRLAEMAA